MAKFNYVRCKKCETEYNLNEGAKNVFCPCCGNQLTKNGKNIGYESQNIKNFFTGLFNHNEDVPLKLTQNGRCLHTTCSKCNLRTEFLAQNKNIYCYNCGHQIKKDGKFIDLNPDSFLTFVYKYKKWCILIGIIICMIAVLLFGVTKACTNNPSNQVDTSNTSSAIVSESSETNSESSSESSIVKNADITAIDCDDDSNIEIDIGDEETINFNVESNNEVTEDDFVVDISDKSVLKMMDLEVDTDELSNSIKLTVKALKQGKATLTIKNLDKSVSSKPVSFVVNSVKKIEFRESSKLKLSKGKTKTVVAFAEPKGIKKNQIKVYSSKKSVLKIKKYIIKNSGGKTKIIITVYAANSGNAQIKIKSLKGSASDSRAVYVYKKTTSSSTAPVKNETIVSETIVYVTPTGKKYHTENCRYVNSGSTSMTESEAISKGYGPCNVCH